MKGISTSITECILDLLLNFWCELYNALLVYYVPSLYTSIFYGVLNFGYKLNKKRDELYIHKYALFASYNKPTSCCDRALEEECFVEGSQYSAANSPLQVRGVACERSRLDSANFVHGWHQVMSDL